MASVAHYHGHVFHQQNCVSFAQTLKWSSNPMGCMTEKKCPAFQKKDLQKYNCDLMKLIGDTSKGKSKGL